MSASGTGTGPSAPSSPKRVVRTGLALVHENEIVYPVAGSEAQANIAVDDASNAVAVHFPVVIEVADATGSPAADADTQNQAAMRELANAFRLR